MTKRRRPARGVKGATVNVDGRSHMPLAKLGHFHVLALTEWQNAEMHIREFAGRKGFDVAGARTDVFMVVNGRVLSRTIHEMTEPWWWGPRPWRLRKRTPRRIPELEVEQPDGEVFKVLGTHGSPGGWGGGWFRTRGKNKRANREMAEFMKRWLQANPDGVIPGDWNLTRREVRKHVTTRYANTGKVDGMAWGSNYRHVDTTRYHGIPGHGAGKVTVRHR